MTTPTPPPASQPTPRTDEETHMVKGPNAWAPHDIPCVSSAFSREIECELESEIAREKVLKQAMAAKAAIEAGQRDRELAALRAELEEAKDTFNAFAEQKLTCEMSEEDYQLGDIDFAYDKFIQESRFMRTQLSAPAAQLKAASRPVESPTPQKVPTGEALTGEAYFIDRDLFMRYVAYHVQPARLKEGLAVLSERSCEVSYDIIKQGRYLSAPPATASAAQGGES